MRILAFSGSRAFDTDIRPRSWARRQVARAILEFQPHLIAHGAAKGWDAYAQDFAGWAGIAQACFALDRFGGRWVERGPERIEVGGKRHKLEGAERYRYAEPLVRDEVMMRWLADMTAQGHEPLVVASIAPWSTTGGTRKTIEYAKAFDLPVRLIEVPSAAWPAEDAAHEGQNGA